MIDPKRLTRCQVLEKFTNVRCSAEALDPDAEILICATHAAAVLRLIEGANRVHTHA